MKKGKLIEFYTYVAVFIIGIIVVVNSITVKKIDKKIDTSSKLEVQDVKYKVYLIENSAVPTEYLEMNKMYVAKLIDSVKFNYDLEYNSKEQLIYSVVGKMDVNYLSTNSTAVKPTVAEREYVFIPDTPATVDGKKQIIDTSFKLDYNKYNVELAEIKDVLGLSVEANLDVIFTVKTQDNKTLYTSTASIPLAKEAFSIENKVKDSTNPLGIEKEETEINSAKLLVGLLIIIISGMKAFKVADKSLNVIKENYYTIAREKILRTYGDIIAEMVEPIDTKGIKIADVKNFEQLVDVEEETRSPINFYEVVKNEEGHFVIIHNNIGYRYVLRNRGARK